MSTPMAAEDSNTYQDKPGPWKIAGRLIYSLIQTGWRGGQPAMENYFTARVDPGVAARPEDLDSIVLLMAAAPDLADALADLLVSNHEGMKLETIAALVGHSGETLQALKALRRARRIA